MITRDEALHAYVECVNKVIELEESKSKLYEHLNELDRRIKEYKVIIFAEQVKPQREPKKGGYQPRGKSKEIVGNMLHNMPHHFGGWMGTKQLQETTGLSADQVLEALKQLRKEGIVNRDGTQGRHVYQLAIRKENENQDNSNNSIGKLGDVPSFKQLGDGGSSRTV